MDFIDATPSRLDVPTSTGTHPTTAWLYPPACGETTSALDSPTPTNTATPTPLHTPILFIHGFRGDHNGMALITHHLRTHTALVPDLPGFGHTPPLPTTSINTYVDYLTGLYATATATLGAPPVLAGHSFGSILAAHFAATEPDIPGLILINPISASPLAGNGKVFAALTRLYYRLGRDLPRPLGTALLSNPLIVNAMSRIMATTADPGLRRYIHHQHATYFSTFTDPLSLSAAFDVSLTHTVAEVVSRLTMPVLVIAGNRDSIAPIASTNRLIDSLANARARVFDGVGHLIHYERPEATAKEIESFVDSLENPEDLESLQALVG